MGDKLIEPLPARLLPILLEDWLFRLYDKAKALKA
jgi:hypothetical protein